MTTFYNTEQQTIHSITELLTAHGYDPTDYDLTGIAADYQHTPGLYDSVFNDPSLVWAHVAQHQRNTTKTRDHTSTHQDTIRLTPDQLAKVITHTEQVKTNDGRGLNHLIRDNITAAIVAGEPVHTVCGVSFYPRAMTPDGKVRRTDWETCHACWATWLLENQHGVTL